MTENNAAQAATQEIHEAFELSYAMDADDPVNASDLSHFTNGWRACIMSKLRAEGVQAGDERAAYTDPLSDFQEGQWWVKELDALAQAVGATHDQKRAVAVVHHMLRAAALASAPVADAQDAAGLIEKVADSIIDNFRDAGWSMPSIDSARVREAVKTAMLHNEGRASAPVAAQEFKAAFPNGALPATRFHELWERAGNTRRADYTMLENLTWQVGQFADLVAREVSAPVAGEAVAWRVTHPRSPKPGWEDAAREQPPTPEKVKQQGPDLVLELAYAAPQASEAVRIHNDAIKAAAKVCTDTARQYDPQNNQEHALASELYSAALAIRKLEKDGGDCVKGAGYEDLLALMERAAREAGGSQWVAEGFESRTPGAAFYGGLIMNADGETVVAQCVNESNASHMMSSSPANVLWLIRQYRAALSPTQPTEQGERDGSQ